MAEQTGFATLQGYFKELYADKIGEARPDQVELTKEIKFNTAQKLGNKFNQPISLTYDHGVTYGGVQGGAFNYASAISAETENAEVQAATMIMRGLIADDAINAAMNGDKAAFGDLTKYKVRDLLASAYKKYEQQMWYGGMGLGVVASTGASDVVVTLAEFAPAIWIGAENMVIHIYSSAGVSRGTATVTAVDLSSRTLTLSALPAGTVATDVIYEEGAKGKEFIGIHKIISATTGTIFGIDVTSYALWRGNTYSAASGALTFAKVQEAFIPAVNKGGSGKYCLYVNPSSWASLLTEQVDQRIFHEGAISTYDQGAGKLMFKMHNIEVEIKASPYVKEGYAFGLAMNTFSRIGACDIRFKQGTAGQYLRPLEGANGSQMIIETDSSLFCNKIGHNVVITNIVA